MAEYEEDKHGAPDLREASRWPFPFLVAAAVGVIALIGIFVWPGRQSPPAHTGTQAHLAFGPEEQAYAGKLQLENLSMNRAENFLQQEVTTLDGELLNGGDRAVSNVELTIEFGDEMRQLVLRETRLTLGTLAAPLQPKERREWEISFEHIPSSWNMQQPSIRISGIAFAQK